MINSQINQIEEVIINRRTIHNYKPEFVPLETIKRAVELATYAPNHKLTFPWKFYLVSGSKRSALADITIRAKENKADKAFGDEIKKSLKKKFESEGSLLVLGQKLTANELQKKEDYASLACAVQNMSLYLYQQGYGSKWSTGSPTRDPETYRVLNISPEEIEIVGYLWIGKSDQIPNPTPRPVVDSILTLIG